MTMQKQNESGVLKARVHWSESLHPWALVQIGKSNLGHYRKVVSEGDVVVERPIDGIADRNEKWSTSSGRASWWPCEKSGNLNHLLKWASRLNGGCHVKVLGMLIRKVRWPC